MIKSFIKTIIMIVRLNAYTKTPDFLKKHVKKQLKRARRIRSSVFNMKVTKESLERDLKKIGLSQGDTVIFHSSLSRLGEVEGGADTVIDALLSIVGDSGTVIAPTFFHVGKAPGDYSTDAIPCFDARSTPSGVGKITEIFRGRPQAKRSCHPTHSVAAIGRNAEYIVKDHHTCETPFSNGSPFDRILELGGKWLFLGVDIDKFTLYHVFEDNTPNYPYAVYYQEPLIVKVIDMYGMERLVKTKLHDYNLSLIRIDNDKSQLIKKRVKRHFEEMGALHRGRVGNSNSYLLDAKKGLCALQKMFEHGETIYLAPKEMKLLNWK